MTRRHLESDHRGGVHRWLLIGGLIADEKRWLNLFRLGIVAASLFLRCHCFPCFVVTQTWE